MPPSLIVINQTVNPAFDGWLVDLAAAIGPIELWTGNAPAGGLPGVHVRPARAYDRTSSRTRLITWLTFTVTVLLRLLLDRSRVPLFIVTNPPLVLLLAWPICRLQRRRYALLEWDIYPNILAPMGLASPAHPVYRLWRWLHRQALRRASLVVTLGAQMAQRLRELAAPATLAVHVVPNWVDVGWLRPQPADENPFVQRHGLADKLVVLYAGNIGATHPLETLVATAWLLVDDPDVRLVVVGDGAKRALVEQAIQAGCTSLHLLPPQPEELLPSTLASAQVGFVGMAAGYEQLLLPSRAMAMMAAGAAILGVSRLPNDLEDLIRRYGCGANFAPDAPAAIAGWLHDLAADRPRLAAMRAAARQAAVDHYSAQACAPRLTELVRGSLIYLGQRH
jgi:glycosyltransferase involved in cell wall biosynthesis